VYGKGCGLFTFHLVHQQRLVLVQRFGLHFQKLADRKSFLFLWFIFTDYPLNIDRSFQLELRLGQQFQFVQQYWQRFRIEQWRFLQSVQLHGGFFCIANWTVRNDTECVCTGVLRSG
jgi:hypothetical protein